MRGIFCGRAVKSDEEYCQVIQGRKRLMAVLFVLGLLTASISAWAEWKAVSGISDHMLGVYCGAGVGLMAAAVVLWVRANLLLKNEQKRRELRLQEADERVAEISTRAVKAAAVGLLVAAYLIGLVGGLFYPVLVKALLVLVWVFLLTYLAAYRIYEKKM